MKFVKDTDLLNFGIEDWEIRMKVLDIIQKFQT